MNDDSVSEGRKPKAEPLYRTIHRDLQRMIETGLLAHGESLPSEATLMAQYDTSRPTVHRALVELESEGLVDLHHGKAATVRRWKPIIRNIGKRMSSEVWGAGRSVWSLETEGRTSRTESDGIQRSQAPAEREKEFGTDIVWSRRRLHFVDERPVMISISYYPASIVDGTRVMQTDTGGGGMPEVLAEAGHSIWENRELFYPRTATAEEAKKLRLPKGGTVVDIVRTSRDAGGLVVEVTEMVAAGDAFVFQFDYLS